MLPVPPHRGKSRATIKAPSELFRAANLRQSPSVAEANQLCIKRELHTDGDEDYEVTSSCVTVK